MKILNFKFFIAVVAVVATTGLGFVSCSDDPGADSYYTQTREYAADYLKNRSQYSDFVKILQRATGAEGKNLRLLDMLGTYGTYTVFAPTNEAIRIYLAGKGEGYTSVDQLSKEDCDTIALNSIIEQTFFTTDYNNGMIPQANMLDQYMMITSQEDTESDPTRTKLAIFINEVPITHADDSVSNGVVHTVNRVVLSSTELLSDYMEGDENIKLFCEALNATHLSDSLTKVIDPNYSVGPDSIDWTNPELLFSTAVEYDNVAYMQNRYYKFTAFVCPDQVLEEKYGITDLNGLIAKAHELYDPMYDEDKNITDLTDRRNALNRFVSYHLLDRLGDYWSLTCVDGPNSTLANNWMRNKWDIADWYETMMPYSILKCSFPDGKKSGLYINRRGVRNRADEQGVKVDGVKVLSPAEMKAMMKTPRENTCKNGIYHYIDDIIAYDEQTQKVVLNERLRIDASTLSPDFMNSGARGHYTKTNYENGKYAKHDTKTTPDNTRTCLGFKPGSAKNFIFDRSTHVHVRPRTLSYWSYQGDEVTVIGLFDLTVKLPPVPEGEYELRLFTCTGFTNRGVISVFLDGQSQGIPFDMRPDGRDLFGYKYDTDLGEEDAITAFDKSIHNLGWMKGPKSYGSATSESGGTRGNTFRDNNPPSTVRKVLGRFHSYGRPDEAHYVRFKQVLPTATPTSSAFNFDFIELCPSSVYNNEYFAEDRW